MCFPWIYIVTYRGDTVTELTKSLKVSYKAVSVSNAYLGYTVTALTKSLKVLQGCFSVWCLPWRCCWCTDRRFQSQTSCLHCPLHGWFSEQVNNISVINALLCGVMLFENIVIPCQQNCKAFPIKSPLSAEQSLTIHWILHLHCISSCLYNA